MPLACDKNKHSPICRSNIERGYKILHEVGQWDTAKGVDPVRRGVWGAEHEALCHGLGAQWVPNGYPMASTQTNYSI